MTHSTDPASAGRWRENVRLILRSWYDMTGAAAPYLTPHGVADTMLESLVCEVEAATAADLREELRRAQRTIDNLREQHTRRTFGSGGQVWRDRTWRHLYEQEQRRALRLEGIIAGCMDHWDSTSRQLRNQGDQ